MQLHRADHQANAAADAPRRDEPACPRFLAVERWVLRHLNGVRHERRVAAIASHLFDLTRRLHGLSLAERRLLRLGALVHDVGRSVSKPAHPAEGAAMLLDDTSLPLSGVERRALAYLTCYHRDAVPAAGEDAVLRAGDGAERLIRLLAILRTADALDRRSLDQPARLVFALAPAGAASRRSAAPPRELCVNCYLGTDSPKARDVYRRRGKKFRLLEEMFGVRIEVVIRRAEDLRLVA